MQRRRQRRQGKYEKEEEGGYDNNEEGEMTRRGGGGGGYMGPNSRLVPLVLNIFHVLDIYKPSLIRIHVFIIIFAFAISQEM